MIGWIPGIATLRSYRLAWLPHDLAAGVALTTLLIPVGLANAVASGLPGIHGLYATIVPLLAYAVFGPSRFLVLGPDSSLAALILAVTIPLAAGDPARVVTLAGMMAVVSGVVCILAGVFRLGFVTELLSKPIRYGYMNGIAIALLIAQLPKVLGVTIEPRGPLRDLLAVGREVAAGNANTATLGVGVSTLVLILLLKRFTRVPGVLLAMVAATVGVAYFDLGAAGVKVLGALPQGLPSFALPRIDLADLQAVIVGGAAVAMVSFADTSVLTRTYAARLRTPVWPNREMIGLGAANLATGLFQGFPISSSSVRTAVVEASGGKSQLTGLVGAGMVAALLVFAPTLLADLPNPALAAVVISSALGFFEIADLGRIFRIQRWEFWLSLACTAGVAALGVIPGIGIAIGISIIEFLWDGWRPHHAVLGRVDGVRGFHDLKRYPAARQVPGLVLFRWDAPLFFANAELFQERVLEAVAAAPAPVRRVVVAAEPVTSVDVTSADTLAELAQKLREAGIELGFAEMKDPVKDKLVRFELLDRLGAANFHATIGEAVDDYLADHAVEWRP